MDTLGEKNIELNLSPEGRQLNESFLRTLAWLAKTVLKHVLGDDVALPVRVVGEDAASEGEKPVTVTLKGDAAQVKAFVNTLAHEKNYLVVHQQSGETAPDTQKEKAKLDRAIEEFETKTSLEWPLK